MNNNYEILNLSEIPAYKIYKALPPNLNIKKIVIMPDFTPLTGNIPTGTSVLITNKDWRKYAISDIGCGISLYKTDIQKKDFSKSMWDELFYKMKQIKRGNYGTLGSGNHFLDLMVNEKNNKLFIAIHTGSPFFKDDLKKLIENPTMFDIKYKEIMKTAIENRKKIAQTVSTVFGKMNLIVDKIHNSVEETDKGVIIRKGCVKLEKNEITLLPSSMTGKAFLLKATSKIEETLNSLSHGTGRILSVGETKSLYSKMDFTNLREKIYIPEGIPDNSLKGEVPEAYRPVDEVLNKLKGYIIPLFPLIPIAYIGQL